MATYGAAQLEPTAWRCIVIGGFRAESWVFEMRVSNDVVRLDDFRFIDGIWGD